MKTSILLNTLLSLQLIGSQTAAEELALEEPPSPGTGTWFESQIKIPTHGETGPHDFGSVGSVPRFHDEFGQPKLPAGINHFAESEVGSAPRFQENVSSFDIAESQQPSTSALSTLQDENNQLRQQISRYQKLVDALNDRISELESKK